MSATTVRYCANKMLSLARILNLMKLVHTIYVRKRFLCVIFLLSVIRDWLCYHCVFLENLYTLYTITLRNFVVPTRSV